jgi:hypothetical protein
MRRESQWRNLTGSSTLRKLTTGSTRTRERERDFTPEDKNERSHIPGVWCVRIRTLLNFQKKR